MKKMYKIFSFALRVQNKSKQQFYIRKHLTPNLELQSMRHCTNIMAPEVGRTSKWRVALLDTQLLPRHYYLIYSKTGSCPHSTDIRYQTLVMHAALSPNKDQK